MIGTAGAVALLSWHVSTPVTAAVALLAAVGAVRHRATLASCRPAVVALLLALGLLAVPSSIPADATSTMAQGAAAILLAGCCVLLAGSRGQDRGADVAIEALLAAGVVAFLAQILGLDLVLPDQGGSTVVQATSLMAALVALLTAVCLTAATAARRGPLLLAAGGACLLAARLTAALSPQDAGRLHAGLVIAAAASVAVAFLRPSTLAAATTATRRPVPLTVARLVLVIVAAAAGPVVLAVVGAGWAPPPTSAESVLLGALAALAIVYLTRLLEQRRPLEHLALHDELTGLPNRVLFVERLDIALAQMDPGSATSVLFVDIDRFKKVNDSLGHPAGDCLLQEVAGRLRGALGEDDTVARLGGDEFAVLLTVADEDAASATADRMLAVLLEPMDVLTHEVFVGASIGIAVAPRDGDDTRALLKNADAAMYSAKEGGRGRLAPYRPELNAAAEAHLDLEAALHRALESNVGLAVHYQPKVDLGSGLIVGAEALVRWHHPTRGLLLPDEFIPLAEDTGLIVALGEWVLQHTCADLASWTEEGLAPIVASVNLSARQFQHHSVADIVAGALRSTGLDPSQLELELTESLALQDSERVVAVLNDIRSLGVSCSIDDFGTGYSGLNYLTRFPIDRLKIDRSFVAQIASGGRDARLVTAVIAMAHGLGLGVVAEGVETDEQAAFLRSHGCDQMQGYLFSRPVPAASFRQLLAEQGALDVHPEPLASVHLLRPDGIAAEVS